jgi:hypothetical protein
MPHRLSFIETCDAPVVVIHAKPQDLADPAAAARECARVSAAMGGLQVVQRCASGNALIFGGPSHLRRYAADETVDALPVFEVEIRPAA